MATIRPPSYEISKDSNEAHNIVKDKFDDTIKSIENTVKTHLDNDSKVISLTLENDRLKKEIESYKSMVSKLQSSLDSLETKFNKELDKQKKEYEDKIETYECDLDNANGNYKYLIDQLYKMFTSGIVNNVQENDLSVRDFWISDKIESMIDKHPRIFNKYFRIFGYGSEFKPGFRNNGVYPDDEKEN